MFSSSSTESRRIIDDVFRMGKVVWWEKLLKVVVKFHVKWSCSKVYNVSDLDVNRIASLLWLIEKF